MLLQYAVPDREIKTSEHLLCFKASGCSSVEYAVNFFLDPLRNSRIRAAALSCVPFDGDCTRHLSDEPARHQVTFIGINGKVRYDKGNEELN